MEIARLSRRPRLSTAGLLPLLGALLLLPGCEKIETEEQPVTTAEDASEEAPEQVKQHLTAAQEELAATIDAMGEEFDGEVGIAVREIGSGWTTSFNGHELFPQQSVSKLWVALAVLDQVDAGDLSLNGDVTIERDDLTVFHQPIRDLVLRHGSYRTDNADLLDRALTRSDNTANDVLLRQVGGPDAVRKVLAENGLEGIRFGPGERQLQSAIAGLKWDRSFSFARNFWDARDEVPPPERQAAWTRYIQDPPDGATPEAIVNALARLQQGELLSEHSTERLLTILENTRSGPRRLKGGVPDDWLIAHKTGTGQFFDIWQSGYNDVGIVTAPDGQSYAIAVMMRLTSISVPDRMKMMQDVVRAVVEYHRQEQARTGSGSEDEAENETGEQA